MARRIAENAPIAVQAVKQLANAAGGEGVTTTLESLAAGFTASTEDGREGVAEVVVGEIRGCGFGGSGGWSRLRVSRGRP